MGKVLYVPKRHRRTGPPRTAMPIPWNSIGTGIGMATPGCAGYIIVCGKPISGRLTTTHWACALLVIPAEMSSTAAIKNLIVACLKFVNRLIGTTVKICSTVSVQQVFAFDVFRFKAICFRKSLDAIAHFAQSVQICVEE